MDSTQQNPNASWGGQLVGSLAPGQNNSVAAMLAKLAGQGLGTYQQFQQNSLQNQGNQMANQMTQQTLAGLHAADAQDLNKLAPQTTQQALATPATQMPSFSQYPTATQQPNPFSVTGQ